MMSKIITCKTSIKILFKCCLTLVLICGLHFFCKAQTDGFAVSKIQSSFPVEEGAENPAFSEEIDAALAQPFTYLGRGAQCFVFASQDGNYVLKFLHVSHIEASWFLRHVPLPFFLQKWRAEKVLRKEQKHAKDFTSYQIANSLLKDETGLLLLHLQKSKHLHKTIQLVDKLGISHKLDLDSVEFILQKKATPLFTKLEELLNAHNTDLIRTLLKDLVHLLSHRQTLGISDKDPDLLTNFGVIGLKPVQIDIGRFKLASSTSSKKDELLRITDSLRNWLKQREPELAHDVVMEIEKLDR
jgi:hypothetical protein